MIELGERVLFGKGTDENDARRMLKEAAKKICPGIDESRIKLIIKKDWWGYITGAWHVQVKEKEYIRMLEERNAELVRKTDQLQRERDAAVKILTDIVHITEWFGDIDICSACKKDNCKECRTCNEGFEWRGVPEPPEEE